MEKSGKTDLLKRSSKELGGKAKKSLEVYAAQIEKSNSRFGDAQEAIKFIGGICALPDVSNYLTFIVRSGGLPGVEIIKDELRVGVLESIAGNPPTSVSRPTVSFYYDTDLIKHKASGASAVHYNPMNSGDVSSFPQNVENMLLRHKDGEKTLENLRKMTPEKVTAVFKAVIE